MASTNTSKPSGLGFDFGTSGPSHLQYVTKHEEDQAKERLQKMGNRKAISSEDFMFDDSKNAEIDSRVQAMKSQGVT